MKKIIELIKNLLNNDVVSSLSNRGISAIAVFTKTINELTEINSEIQTVVELKHEEIEKLKYETQELTKQEEFNTKIINKINNLLEE